MTAGQVKKKKGNIAIRTILNSSSPYYFKNHHPVSPDAILFHLPTYLPVASYALLISLPTTATPHLFKLSFDTIHALKGQSLIVL